MTSEPGKEADTGRAAVLHAFVREDGTLRSIPARQHKKIIIMEYLVKLFEPDLKYPETEVNRILRACHDDVAALRRHLVQAGFLDRDNGIYWRVR
jgi:hypothetical protein